MSICDKDICKICEVKIAYHKYPCTNNHNHIKSCKSCIIKCYSKFGKCPYCNEEDMIPLYNAYNELFNKMNHLFPIKSGCFVFDRYKNIKLGEWRKKYLKWVKKYNYPEDDMKINYICKNDKFPCLTNDDKYELNNIKGVYKYNTLLDDFVYSLNRYKIDRKNVIINIINEKDNINNKINNIKKLKKNKYKRRKHMCKKHKTSIYIN